jgi:hypothetical protein
MSRAGRKNGVLLCSVGPEFRPDHPWETPAIVLGATLYAEGLALCESLGFTHVYNSRQLETRMRDGTWAVPIRRGHLFSSPDAPELQADCCGRAHPALGVSREAIRAAIAAGLCPDGQVLCGVISREMSPAQEVAAVLTPSPAMRPGDGHGSNELDLVLDQDIEATPADLLVESCS